MSIADISAEVPTCWKISASCSGFSLRCRTAASLGGSVLPRIDREIDDIFGDLDFPRLIKGIGI